MGYYMHDGSKWSKDFLVLDLEQAIANAETSCTVLRVAQVYSPQADIYFPMKDHLIQKVVVQAKVTPQDVLKHLAKQEKKGQSIKSEVTGEDQSSADADSSNVGEVSTSADVASEQDSETGGVSPSPSIRRPFRP